MGYDTRFRGSIAIVPAADPALVAKVNDYCRDNDGKTKGPGRQRLAGIPDYGWCDWIVSADGASIKHWEETEKSYEMEAWLAVLIRDFFAPAGHVLNGSMLAQGEDIEDRWHLVVTDNVVTRRDKWIANQGAGTLAIERWRVKREVQTASRSREHAAEVMAAIDGYTKVAHSIHCARVALVMLAEIDDPLLRARLTRLFKECE